ncbi:putative transposase/invertase (TIGR01784 family) [Pedobacter sp. AK017]|uniref:hypothetical protein n=1 Tax=Pedobacter sp. AK017 TaxID=2723073 RepID=UPI001613AC35|nr:hypothetical protein [Pedobacter sp. AK017]MBB5436597.1 putative transposase/invertase (TIGR01784 family) [Pedobacter sp. AK017]
MLEVKTFWKKERDVLYKWGQEDGIQTGKAKGRHEEALAIAREMKKDKFPIDKIAKLTKLSIEEIEQL